ncbi:hypothetical protein IP91_01907 [Pseudoduganella lurida]|uniref:Uncharacterized protein n=1 Tax=Pseudoduganella lurida TaxID=1036180 RepID=A0A562RCF0_9BURK|nr:hypothetical protein IP91_01907 [Pseudoduganella lurida]
MSVKVGSGHRRHRSAPCAIASTLSVPPARSAAKKAMTVMPTTSTIIWMKSVIATARKPPTTT